MTYFASKFLLEVFSPVNDKTLKNNYSVIVFAKVKGYPFWPARIANINVETDKNVINVMLSFSKQMKKPYKANIYSFRNNKIKYSADSVAIKYKESYTSALIKASKELYPSNQ